MGQLKDLEKDTSVLTSTYIIHEGMPILEVSNEVEEEEEEGSFLQFHCGNGDYDMDKMLLVRLDTILKLDKELGMLNLKIGEEAKRSDKASKWKKNKL